MTRTHHQILQGSIIGQGFLISALLLGLAQTSWATTGTTLDGATENAQNLFLLGVFLLGFAGLATVAYTIARNRYGMIWDEAISILAAVAVGASALTILGWVGSSAAATMPHVSTYEAVIVHAPADGDQCPWLP